MNTEALCIQFGTSSWFMDQALQGIDHATSLEPSPAGNTINWLVGHLADARNGAVAVLTGEHAWAPDELARYQRGQAAFDNPAEALQLDDLAGRFSSLTDKVIAGLQGVTPERAAEKAPFSPSGNPDETVGSLLATMAFHEVYHLGQVGMMRRLVGRPRVI